MTDVEKTVDADIQQAFLNGCKGNFKVVKFKNGQCRINGKLIISGDKITDANLVTFQCKEMHGQLVIENCPKLTSLKDSFLSKIHVFDGSITINQCPNLESLEGLPSMINNDLTVSNCKKVKNLGTCESVLGNIYWSHNGKRLTKDQILDKTHCIGRVFCESLDEQLNESEEIFETLNNPWLQKLAKQLKQYPGGRYEYKEDRYQTVPRTFKDLMRESNGGDSRLFDKIESDEIEVFNMKDKKDKDALKNLIYFTYNKSDNDHPWAQIILVFDEDLGEFVYAYGNGNTKSGVERIQIPNKNNPQSQSQWISWSSVSKTDVRTQLLDRLGIGYTVVAILNKYESPTGSNARWNLQHDRQEARKGMITPGDAKQYAQIAQENIKRYKDILAKNRALQKNDKYSKLCDEVEDIMTRVFKLSRDIMKNPAKYDNNSYKVRNFLDWVKDEKRSFYNRGRYESSGNNGLMYVFNHFIEYYQKMNSQDPMYKDDIQSYAKSTETYAEALKKAIEYANNKLNEFGF